MTTNQIKGSIYVILSAMIFGLMPIFGKVIYGAGSNALTLTFHRFLFSVPLTYCICKKKKLSLKVSRQEKVSIGLLSVWYCVTPLLLFISYEFISSGLSTTLHFVYPVVVFVLCAVFYKDKINGFKGIACLMCMIGLSLFYTPSSGGHLMGIGIALLSGVTYAMYITYLAKSAVKEVSSYVLSFYLSVIGSIALFILTIITRQLTFNLSLMGWVLSIGFSACTSGLATILFQEGAKRVGPQSAALLSTFEPVTSIIVGLFVFDEQLTVQATIGMVLILLAVVVLQLADRIKKSSLE